MNVDATSPCPRRPGGHRFALASAGTVVAYLLLVHFAIAPLHERGAAQALTSKLCAVGHLLEVPGRFVTDPTRTSTNHHPRPFLWFPALLLNGVFYFCAARALGWIYRRERPALIEGGTLPAGPPRPLSRRRFLRTAATTAIAGGGAAFGYAFFLEPGRITVSRRQFPIRGLPPSLEGLRIVQLTDIHLGPWITLEYVHEALRMANALEPDLIVLTGDYVHRSKAYIEPVVKALTELRARIGVAGVLGNHDWWEDGSLARSAFARAGIPLIDNSRRFVTPGRKLVAQSAEGLCLAGVGDLWEDAVRFDWALGGVPAGMPRILLSHNPDAAEEPELVQGGYRVDLMLSGHTHGGQVRLPVLGTPIVPSRFGQKYAHGLVEGPVCPVYTSSGIGMTVMPLRMGVPPEIAVIELARE